MKYYDKNFHKWQSKQDRLRNQEPYLKTKRSNRRELDNFAMRHIDDKEWWRILSWDEREKVYLCYGDTKSAAQRRFDQKDNEFTTYWSFYEAEVADVDGDTWEECFPQWLKYVKEKYPQDASVRRDLAIRRIFS